jgi:hypothetical protein
LIEIGKERGVIQGAKRAERAFFFIGAVLVLVWLLRGLLAVSQYSETLLIASFGAGFIAQGFDTNLSRGVPRAISSFLWNMAWQCIFIIVMIWFLGWIATLQADSLPVALGSKVPDLLIVAIFLGLASFIARQASQSSKEINAGGPALILRQASATDLGSAKLSVKSDSIGLPVRSPKKIVGCVILGDLNAVFETPMGMINATIAGPVTSFGVPFKGVRASREQVVKLSGKELNELIRDTQVETRMVGETEIEVDLPSFIHVKRNEFQDSVEGGLVSVKRGPKSEVVKVGPISIDAEEYFDRWQGGWSWGKHRRISPWWSLKGKGDWSYISSSGEGVKARWNGSSLELRQGSMKLKVGSDGFTYSPQELETYTPLHNLKVTQDKVTLNTKRFTLDVIGARVILRTEDGSKRTDSTELARDLKALLADTAKKQVSDVLEGQPIELDEMLRGTEELLKKYA